MPERTARCAASSASGTTGANWPPTLKCSSRALFRTVLFQAFPGLYGLRVRGAIERMDAEQKQRYSEAR